MRKVKEVIVVEGRYDKNTLAQVVDATVVTLGGFAVFNDKEKVAFLRRLAAERGLIVLTDSDGAGFVIRNYLKGALPKEQVKQAYIPDIHGGSPPGGGHIFRRNGGASGGKNAHHQGRPDGVGAGRGCGQRPAAAGASAKARPAGAPDRQRDAGGAEPADRPGRAGTRPDNGRTVKKFPPMAGIFMFGSVFSFGGRSKQGRWR